MGSNSGLFLLRLAQLFGAELFCKRVQIEA